jgi:hypothetical protein
VLHQASSLPKGSWIRQTMNTMNLFSHLFFLNLISHNMICCRSSGFILAEGKLMPNTRALCSSQIEDISTIIDIIQLLYQDGVVGIYKKNEIAGQVCYWKEVKSGLIEVASLSGGSIHTIGKQNNDWYFFHFFSAVVHIVAS